MAAEVVPSAVVVDANVLVAVVRPDIGHLHRDDVDGCARLLVAIDSGQVKACIPAPVLAEVIHVLARSGISPLARAELAARWLSMPGRLEVLPVDGLLAVEAGEYRHAHYHHERLPLSYADCFCVAFARRLAVPLVTADEALQRAPGVVVVAPSRLVLR